MLTVIFCLVGISILLKIFWNDDGAGVFWGVILCSSLVVFGIVFPFIGGDTDYFDHKLATKEINGKYYYDSGGTWIDILEISDQEQSDELRVEIWRTKGSQWKWSYTYKKVFLPVVSYKEQ